MPEAKTRGTVGEKSPDQRRYEGYVAHITAYEREFDKWLKRAEKILRIYKDESSRAARGAKFNVLWSNVQTLKASTFARMPQPDVSRRFRDDDPVGRVAALMIERALEFEVTHYRDFGASLRQAVYDRFLPGRGVAWVRYEPTFRQVEAGAQPEDGPTLTEDADAESEVAEELDFECAPVDYVHWKDFGHGVARTWEEVTLVWRRVYLTRQQRDELGDEFKAVPLDAMPEEDTKTRSGNAESVNMRALVYEIWDKDTGECVFLSKSLGRIVKAVPDPLGLEEFFPCPPPLYATLTTDSLVPIPDYALYQDQARELDLLAKRIDGLVAALKVAGVYDQSQPELARLFTESENGDLIPVANWAKFAEGKGLAGAIDLVDLAPIAAALREAYGAFEQIKGQIYELTGISDIIRGQTAPSETATAQQIKNNYASMRLKTYQDEVERFASRLLQLKAQIICRHFDDETICEISGCEQLSEADRALVPQALALLRDNVSRAFRIEVTTDSMVFQDEQQEKQERTELLQAVSGYVEKIVQASQTVPQVAPLGVELLKYALRSYRVGKSIEGTIDAALQQLKQSGGGPQAQNPQDAGAAAQAQANLQKTGIQENAETQRLNMRHQHEQQMAQFEANRDMQLEQFRASMDQRIAAMEQSNARTLAQINGSLQVLLQQMRGQSAVEVAELGKAGMLQNPQIAAARAGTQPGTAP